MNTRSTKSAGRCAPGAPLCIGWMFLMAVIALADPTSSYFAVGGANPALGGKFSATAFVADQETRQIQEREEAVLALICAGRYPSFLNEWRTVTISGQDKNAQPHTVQFEVMPDYLSVGDWLTPGDPDDWMRMPLQPWTAQRACDEFDWSLPTPKMVDAIWAASEVKLAPQPLLEPRTTPTRFLVHHNMIEDQLAGRGIAHEADGEMKEKIEATAAEAAKKEADKQAENSDETNQQRAGTSRPFIAGTKKDVVITNRMVGKPDKVAIYGWHYQSGTPIQPVYTGHVYWYLDYSHGARPVKRTILLDGEERDLHDILQDPVLHTLLSNEGQMQFVKYSDPD